MLQTIVDEMTKGNFSFLILVVGVLQLILMWKNYKIASKIEEDEHDSKD